jgi:hypothetical protein
LINKINIFTSWYLWPCNEQDLPQNLHKTFWVAAFIASETVINAVCTRLSFVLLEEDELKFLIIFKRPTDLDFSSSRLCSWSRQALYSTKNYNVNYNSLTYCMILKKVKWNFLATPFTRNMSIAIRIIVLAGSI